MGVPISEVYKASAKDIEAMNRVEKRQKERLCTEKRKQYTEQIKADAAKIEIQWSKAEQDAINQAWEKWQEKRQAEMEEIKEWLSEIETYAALLSEKLLANGVLKIEDCKNFLQGLPAGSRAKKMMQGVLKAYAKKAVAQCT